MAARHTLAPHQGVMAHRIIFEGKEYAMSIARIEGGEVVITPYTGEVHSTLFVNGTVAVTFSDGRLTIEEAMEQK